MRARASAFSIAPAAVQPWAVKKDFMKVFSCRLLFFIKAHHY
jgi:hypothetical protein